jgi:O-antigen ligase
VAGASSDANVLLAEVGILGLIAIGILWLQAFRHVRSITRQAQDRYLRALATGSQYIVLIMGIATMTYNGWEVPYMAALFWLMLGVLTVLSRNDRYAERQG